MWISISVQDDSLFVMELVEVDGALTATDRMMPVEPGERLGDIPYVDLLDLGEGEHEVSLGTQGFRVSQQPRSEPRMGLGGYVFLALVFFAMAPVAYYWALGLAEGPARRVRIHWLVALVYGLGERLGIGGQWFVGGLFAVVGLLFLCGGLWTTQSNS